MPTDPLQLALAVLELTFLFGGGGLLLTILFNPRQRQRWLGTNLLPYWPLTLAEFALCAVLVFFFGSFTQIALQKAFGHVIAASPDKAGLELLCYGGGIHIGFLLGCAAFPRIRRSFYSNYGTEPPPLRNAPALPWRKVLLYAGGTVIVALPVLSLLSLGWTAALRAVSLPDEPQDLLAIFSQTKSIPVVVGMLLVACVLAPLSEEILFRAGLYRYIRQKLGRTPALLISGIGFGALHGNWAGFLPLAVLGMMLAIVYEATGSLRVNVLAHAFFNLNTLLIVISGLPQATS